MSGREAAASEGSGAPKKAGAGLQATSLPWAFLHLAVLTAFALGQPLFDLLGKNPEFFAARGSSAGDIIAFSLLVVVGPPLIGILIEFLVGLASKPARQVVHLVFLAVLTALGVIQFLKDSISSDVVLIVLSLGIGALLAFGYSKAEPVRSFLSVLSPAPLVLLIVFLFISPVSDIVTAGDAEAKDVKGGSNAPIVFLGLDEFPGISIMDSQGKIDAKRFPGFAELAKSSTWFPNAHSIYDSTSRAWPAIMDGNYPEKDKRLPTSADHPNSIFAILGKSHSMNVSEEATTVCPNDLCKDERQDEPFVDRIKSMTDDLGLVYQHMVAPPGIEKDLDTVSETWGDFGGGGGGGGTAKPGAGGSEATGPARGDGGKKTLENLRGGRTERLDEWIASIKDTRRPTLNFKHLLLPHVPWQYLPDGRTYSPAGTDPIPQISRQSYKDQGQVDVLQQRHLLQVGFVDSEIQRLIAHLKKEGRVGQGDGRRHRRPRRVVQEGPVRPAQGQRQQRGRARARAAVHQGPRAGEGQGRPRERGDHRRAAHDAGHPEHRVAGEDRRQVGVLGGGAQPRRVQDAQARPVGLDPHAGVRVRTAQDAEDARTGGQVRPGQRRPRADLPDRAQPAAAGPEGTVGRHVTVEGDADRAAGVTRT